MHLQGAVTRADHRGFEEEKTDAACPLQDCTGREKRRAAGGRLSALICWDGAHLHCSQRQALPPNQNVMQGLARGCVKFIQHGPGFAQYASCWDASLQMVTSKASAMEDSEPVAQHRKK